MRLSRRVFRIDNVIKGVPVGSDYCHFSEEPLVKALKDIIREYTGSEDASMADTDQSPNFCPVFVVATEGQDAGGPVKLFRSYGFYKDQCPIWQAARATSAAPSYFRPAWVNVPAPGGWYIDGGLRRNNPSEVALSEARKYWKVVRRFCIVNIGTGKQETVDFIEVSTSSGDMDGEDSDGGEDNVPNLVEATSVTSTSTLTRAKRALGSVFSSVGVNIVSVMSKAPLANSAVKLSRVPGDALTLKRFAQELVKLSTESEDTHRRMWELANNPHDESLQFPYYRFNIPAGMEQIGLEEWKKITKMGALTRGYLATPSVETNVEECAKSPFNPTVIESTQFP
jgi:predicted acylesterase/phospholipase RssA